MADDDLDLLQELLDMAEDEESAAKDHPQIAQQHTSVHGTHHLQGPESLRARPKAALKMLSAGKICELKANNPRLQNLPAEPPARTSFFSHCYLVLQHFSQQAQLPPSLSP